MRATRTNGRKDSNGVFKAGHNDRSFNLENAEHVDADRSKWNVYWDYLQGYNLADENGVRPERQYLFDEVEYLYYHKQFGDSIDAQNERHEKSRHAERIRNVRQIMEDSRTCPEETIYQLGTKDGYEDPAVFVKVAAELFEVIQEKYGSHMQILDWALHMDEATPHLHIDFVPFTTGSKRGLDTRVSLKQALAKHGFKGGSRGDTEWSQWVQSEKEQLSAVMERHGIEWEHKGTHEKHLSVLDYKKQEREKEVVQLEGQILEKKEEFQILSDRVENYDKGIENLKTLEQVLDTSPEYQLPEPQGLMSAKTYKNKLAEPLVQKLKSLVKTALIRCFEAYDSYYRLNITNSNLHRENERLTKTNEKLAGENENLRAENKNYKLLKKAFGSKQMDSLLEQAKAVQQSKQRGKHFRNNQEER